MFRRWRRAGIRQRILTALRARADADGLIGWDVRVDSTVCRAHQHAARARGAEKGDLQIESPGGAQEEPADHELERSRGGLSTKPQSTVDRADGRAAG